MSHTDTQPSRCPWCRFHPDTRKVFVFFLVLVALIVAAKGAEDESKSASRAHKKQIRVVPMAIESVKKPAAAEKSVPLTIEKESQR